jgi:hypothetical protein
MPVDRRRFNHHVRAELSKSHRLSAMFFSSKMDGKVTNYSYGLLVAF